MIAANRSPQVKQDERKSLIYRARLFNVRLKTPVKEEKGSLGWEKRHCLDSISEFGTSFKNSATFICSLVSRFEVECHYHAECEGHDVESNSSE